MTQAATDRFHLLEATIDALQQAYVNEVISARELTQLYLNRIEAYDRAGPSINSIITVAPDALTRADHLDAAMRSSGPVGPLHGVPIILKDQMDAAGMPTTLGSILFKDYRPTRDSFVAARLRKAGAIILGKATLGELGGGDTHGSLFGSTKNPYDLERTPGGSSGGSGAAVSANFAALGVGQEGFASIRRPAAWNSIVGMRPTAGLVSRAGVYAGWPGTNGSLGPMARTVRDLAGLLDVMVGYDPEDPITAHGVGHVPASFAADLRLDGLKGARIGVLREPMGQNSEPDSEDFARVTQVFDRAIGELGAAGATIVDPVDIANLLNLLAKRRGNDGDAAFNEYYGRGGNPPFKSLAEMRAAPDFSKVMRQGSVSIRNGGSAEYYESLAAREELMTNLLKVMADHNLDAIVHKTVEHLPTLIREGINPPYYNSRGATHLNTYLVYVPSISVPAGFTGDHLPVGITFLGRPYTDGAMLKLAYAYEQATHHRTAPTTAPALAGEP